MSEHNLPALAGREEVEGWKPLVTAMLDPVEANLLKSASICAEIKEQELRPCESCKAMQPIKSAHAHLGLRRSEIEETRVDRWRLGEDAFDAGRFVWLGHWAHVHSKHRVKCDFGISTYCLTMS